VRPVFRMTLALSVFALLTSSACGSAARVTDSREVIRVATDASFPPFGYLSEDTGEVVGFEIDLMNTLAERAGLRVEYSNLTWDEMLDSMNSCGHDAYIATIAEYAVPEREETCWNVYFVGPGGIIREFIRSYCIGGSAPITFTQPYFDSGWVVTVRADNADILSYRDLEDKETGMLLSHPEDQELAQQLVGGSLLLFEDPGQPFELLLAGDLDAVIDSLPRALSYVMANEPLLKIVGEPFANETSYAIAVCSQREDLLLELNASLDQVMADGTYEELREEWFGSIY
jgi:ABC-type amino acid transport substrate-binding protein